MVKMHSEFPRSHIGKNKGLIFLKLGNCYQQFLLVYKNYLFLLVTVYLLSKMKFNYINIFIIECMETVSDSAINSHHLNEIIE